MNRPGRDGGENTSDLGAINQSTCPEYRQSEPDIKGLSCQSCLWHTVWCTEEPGGLGVGSQSARLQEKLIKKVKHSRYALCEKVQSWTLTLSVTEDKFSGTIFRIISLLVSAVEVAVYSLFRKV